MGFVLLHKYTQSFSFAPNKHLEILEFFLSSFFRYPFSKQVRKLKD